MRIYIADDDINIIKIVKNIIKKKSLGEVVGFAKDGREAIKDIPILKPDVVIVDYLMPYHDGSAVAKEIKSMYPSIKFIALSQVEDQEMISEFYKSGIDFYMHKPLNQIEIENVLRNVIHQKELEKTVNSIKSMLNFGELQQVKPVVSINTKIKNIKTVMGQIGILGEKGTYDILKVMDYMIRTERRFSPDLLNEAYNTLEGTLKSNKQRMRRAIYAGLVNVAHMGIEDYMNEHFIDYSSGLFDFETVKMEMDYIRKKRTVGGKVSLNKFMECLILYGEKY